MALELIVQTDDNVDDANVYDDLAAWDTYLNDHQRTAFLALDEVTRNRLAVEATSFGEEQVEARLSSLSFAVSQDQRLHFPRQDALDRNEFLIAGLPPNVYREGLFLIGEAMASMPVPGDLDVNSPSGEILEERIDRWWVKYRERDSTFAGIHPSIWARLQVVLPRGRRNRR